MSSDVGNTPGQGLVSPISSAVGKVPAQITKVGSAVGAAATKISATLEATVPKNCSVGTTQFCVGFATKSTCHQLPVDLSQIIPTEIQKDLPDSFDLQAINGVLARITSPYIEWALIAGLVALCILVLAFICTLNGWVNLFVGSHKHRATGIFVHYIIGLLFCAPFLVPTVVLGLLVSKMQAAPSWVQFHQGEVFGLCVGCLCCAATVVFLGGLITVVE